MDNILTYTEAKEIFEEIRQNLDPNDTDEWELYRDMITYAIRYARIRAEWLSLSAAQKMEQDARRTSAHDAFLMSVNIVARLQGEEGRSWRERLGEDRKRNGDFACYIALFLGLEAR